MPLRRAFVSLVLVMAVFVAGISAATIFTCVNVQNQILESVTDYQVLPPQETEDEYNLVIADDEQIVPGENGQLVILSTEYQIANLSDTQRVAYYAANQPEDSGWVVFPVINFDCYFGDTNFGRKYLTMLPNVVIQRSSSFGVSRYRVQEEYLPK